MPRLVIEGDPAGNVVLKSEGVKPDVAERLLIAALAGVQRELSARRTVELLEEQRATRGIMRAVQA